MGDAAMTEVVHVRRGAVRVTGDLTAQGADLLRGTVESLVRSGSRRVLVDLREVRSADPAGVRVLGEVGRALAADGGALVVQPPADWPEDAPRTDVPVVSLRRPVRPGRRRCRAVLPRP